MSAEVWLALRTYECLAMIAEAWPALRSDEWRANRAQVWLGIWLCRLQKKNGGRNPWTSWWS